MADRSFGILVELKDRFTRPFKGLSAPIEKTKKELKALEQAGRDLKWAEKYQSRLEKLQPSLSAARENQSRLAEAMAATENPSKKLTREYEKAKLKLADLETKEREYTAAIKQGREVLRKHGIDTHDLASAREQLARHTDSARAKTLLFHNAIKTLDVRQTAQQFAGLASKILLVKTATATLTAAVAGLVPVLAQAGTGAAMAFGTALSTAKVAAMSKELLKFAETTQMSTQALQEWRLAGRFEGVKADFGELGDMSKVFGDLNEQMGKLGTKEGKDFAKSLNEIGLSAAQIKAIKPDEALMKIGEALGKSKLTDTQQATFLAGISDDAAKLLPLLQKNSASFAEIRQYANQVGAIQTPEELTRMKQTTRELSFWKLGIEGIATRLGQVGGNVVNTLGPNVRKLFVDAQQPIKDWSLKVSAALAQFKADVDDMGWGVAFKRQIQEAYPTLYSFLSGLAEFGKGFGSSFISPMLDSLGAAFDRIGKAMGGGDGIEAAGRSFGEMMRPMTAIVDEVSKAIAFLIENFRFMKAALDYTPLGVFLDSLKYIRAALDLVGDGIKWLGQALGLIDPESKASGFTVLLGALAALAAAAFANKLALGAMGAAFNVFKFALSPIMPLLGLLRSGLVAGLSPLIIRLGSGATVLSRAFIAVRVALSVLFFALRANPIGFAITAIAMGAGLIIKHWSKILSFAKKLWSSVKSTFSAARAALSSMSWGEIAVTIIKAVATLPLKLFKIATQAVGRFTVGILSKLGLVDSAAAKVLTGFVDGFANLPLKLMEIGKQAIAGLVNGIKSAGSAALDAAKALASEIGNTFTGFFKIRSPSRLMHGYGGYISQGLGLGITEQGKQAIKAARGLSDGVRKQMQTGVVVSLAEARKKREAQQSALPQRETLASALSHRVGAGASKQEVGGEIRVRIDAPAGYNTSAKVSKPAGSAVGITANVGRMSW